MAIDDYRLIDGACQPIGSCDFGQEDFCAWSEDAIDTFHWQIKSGRSAALAGGPPFDHTTGTNGGKFSRKLENKAV